MIAANILVCESRLRTAAALTATGDPRKRRAGLKARCNELLVEQARGRPMFTLRNRAQFRKCSERPTVKQPVFHEQPLMIGIACRDFVGALPVKNDGCAMLPAELEYPVLRKCRHRQRWLLE